ncbi:gastrula zinc finger protein XlCGF71.1-like, partial [Diaphorina citri]|uniref:Gastrula zinc finger protein XlCGF71.1-like n=1 Tax=Diaphorina citri TaxID=121845 RepID=A0A3Q0J2E6_DIACI
FSRLTCDQCHSTEEAGCKCNRQLLQCSLCSETFKSKPSLRAHIWKCQMEPQTILETYNILSQCPVCKLTFTDKRKLKSHLKTHSIERSYTCHHCGKQLCGASNLSLHIKSVHLKIKDHSCDVCDKSFVNRAGLRLHKLIHSEERGFVCDLCGASFKQRPALWAHKKLHDAKLEYKFKCILCDRKFHRNSKLNSHMRTHSDVRPYKCDICEQHFKFNYDIQMHKRCVHSNIRPYQCTLCSASFKRSSHLKQHGKTHIKPEHDLKTKMNL